MATNNPTNPDNNEVQTLKAELETLRRDFSQLTDTFKRMSREQIDAGTGYARESTDHLRGQAREAAQGVEREIAARPMTSVLTAFGIGFIVGKLLDR